MNVAASLDTALNYDHKSSITLVQTYKSLYNLQYTCKDAATYFFILDAIAKFTTTVNYKHYFFIISNTREFKTDEIIKLPIFKKLHWTLLLI